MSRNDPKVPKLHPQIRVQLALEISAYMTERAANILGIPIAAPDAKRKGGPKDWFPVYGVRYSREAQELFNRFYGLGLEIIEGIFGPDSRPLSKTPQPVPELPDSVRMRLASEIARAMGELTAGSGYRAYMSDESMAHVIVDSIFWLQAR